MDMTPRCMIETMPELHEYLCDAHEEIDALLHLPKGEWRAKVGTDKDAHAADRHVKRVCTAVLAAASGKQVTIFRAKERALRAENHADVRYGRALLERMAAHGAVVRSDRIDELHAQLAESCLTPGMPEEDALAALVMRKELWLRLPPAERPGRNADLRMLLKLIPDDMMQSPTQTLRLALKDELHDHEIELDALTAQGIPRLIARKGPAPWTYATLAERVAGRVSRAPAAGNNVHTFTRERGKGGGKSDGNDQDIKCQNCGRKHKGGWRACNRSCQHCGLGFCPGTVKPTECPTLKASMPPREQVKNACGEKLPKSLYEQCVEQHAKAQGTPKKGNAHPTTLGDDESLEEVDTTRERTGAIRMLHLRHLPPQVEPSTSSDECLAPTTILSLHAELLEAIATRTETLRDADQLRATCTHMRRSITQRVVVPKHRCAATDPRAYEWLAAEARSVASVYGPPAEHRARLKQVMYELYSHHSDQFLREYERILQRQRTVCMREALEALRVTHAAEVQMPVVVQLPDRPPSPADVLRAESAAMRAARISSEPLRRSQRIAQLHSMHATERRAVALRMVARIRELAHDIDTDPAPGTEAFERKRQQAAERRRVAALERAERHAVRDVDDVDKPPVRDEQAASELHDVLHGNIHMLRQRLNAPHDTLDVGADPFVPAQDAVQRAPTTAAPACYVGPEQAMQRFATRAAQSGVSLSASPSGEGTSDAPAAGGGSACVLHQAPVQMLGDVALVRFLLDTGADVDLLVQPELRDVAKCASPVRFVLDGIGGSTAASEELTFAAALAGSSVVFDLSAPASSQACSVNVTCFSKLRRLSGAVIRLEPELFAYDKQGVGTPVLNINDTYYIDVLLGADAAAVRAASSAHAQRHSIVRPPCWKGPAGNVHVSVRRRADNPLHLHAVRYCCDSVTLTKLSRAVRGIDVSAKEMREAEVLINNDEAYRRAWTRRPPAKQGVPPKMRQLHLPCAVLALDACALPDACFLTKHDMTVSAICTITKYGMICSGKQHSTSAYIIYINDILLEVKVMGHVCTAIKVDAESTLARPESRAAIERACLVRLIPGAGGRHESVADVEANNDVLSRMGEAAMYRARHAGAPRSAAILCRMYQQVILNHKPPSGQEPSRRQLVGLPAPDASSQPLHCFWTECTFIADEKERHDKGAGLDRAPVGNLIGFQRNKYLVWKPSTQRTVTRVHVTPLNEHVIARVGIAAGGATDDVQIQCDLSALPPVRQLVQPVAAPKAPAPVIKYVLATRAPDVGDKVRVMWQEPKGELHRAHSAAVVEVRGDNHVLKYDGWQKQYVHDLAKDQATGRHLWHSVVAPVPKPVAAAPAAAPVPAADRAVTRSRNVCVLSDMLDEILEFVPDPVETFNNVCWAALGDAAEPFEARDNRVSLERHRIMLREAEMTGSALVANIHTATIATASSRGQTATVVTELGDKIEIDVPASLKRVNESPYRAQWLEADRKALFESILMLPGNKLVPEDEVIAAGGEILPCVSQRKVKTYPSSGKLEKFKSRHCVDEKRLNAWRRKRLGPEEAQKLLDAVASFTQPANDAEEKGFLSCHEKGDVYTLLDWPDAYGHGICKRVPRFLKIPDTLDLRDEQGRRLCIMLVTSLWGERAAGFEWETRRDADLKACGWLQCEGVPSMYHHGTARGIIIIDDMLCRTKGNNDVVLRTAEKLTALSLERGGRPLTVKSPAREYGGTQLMESLDGMTMTMMMPVHIEQSMARFLPKYVASGVFPPGVPRGKSLEVLIDSLKLAEGSGPLSADQRQVQQITGDLRWMLKCLIRLVRFVHKLSCVAQRAKCPDALLAAQGVLIMAYEHRREGLTWGGTFGQSCITGSLAGSMESARGESIAVMDPNAKLAAGAPEDIEGYGDATWGLSPDTYFFALTHRGALVAQELKNIRLVLGSSTETEREATLKLSDKNEEMRNIITAAGCPPDGPTILASDNAPNLRVASGHASAARVRHALRKWTIITQRIAERNARLAHLGDAGQPADFGTKWVSAHKVEASVAYLSGTLSRRAHPQPDELAKGA